jgi:UDP-glucose 4-epimerase
VNILVTGGAGYIGSFIAQALRGRGDQVVVIDDLSEGHEAALAGAELIRGDFADESVVAQALGRCDVDAVVHMAASALVGVSVADPAAYYKNNFIKSMSFLDQLRERGISRLVFSSTAAVYGEPLTVPISEDHVTNPTNPYGATKLAFEHALHWYGRAYGIRSVSLRYFNAAGGGMSPGSLGEDHHPETHLIPNVLRAASGKLPHVEIFGTDYPTEDGSCVRDYVHVMDLAQAHILALDSLAADSSTDNPARIFNLGADQAASVRQVIATAEEVSGGKIAVKEAPRRPGDPAILIASSAKAREELGWQPRFSDLRTILETALEWHRASPEGYLDAP